LQGLWQQLSTQGASNPSLSRQSWPSFLALRFFCSLRTLWPQPSWRPLRSPWHGLWLRCGWPERLFSWSWKHSFYAFSVTQPARGTATPLFDVLREPTGATKLRIARIGLYCAQYSPFSAKISDLRRVPGPYGAVSAISPISGLNPPSWFGSVWGRKQAQ